MQIKPAAVQHFCIVAENAPVRTRASADLSSYLMYIKVTGRQSVYL